jgi:hypothetical protein
MKGGLFQMQNNKQITLNDIFSSGKEMLQNRLAIIEPGEKISSLKDSVLKEAKVSWPGVFKQIEEKIPDLLNIGIPDILLMAWNKYSILLKYLDKDKYPPDETFLVNLVDHTIKSEHHPFIEILFNEVPKTRIDFTITISLAFKGIILKIQDGKIMEIMTGSCKAKGSVKCENLVLPEMESDSFTLPGSIKLGDGIPIAG